MTLTEFLLARIAEDEDAARTVEVPSGVVSPVAPGVVVWHNLGRSLNLWAMRVSSAPSVGVQVDQSRVLAECEAKRRIVDTADRMILDADDPESEMSAKERFIAVSCAMVILRGLAAVHADHPDYCEEWKP